MSVPLDRTITVCREQTPVHFITPFRHSYDDPVYPSRSYCLNNPLVSTYAGRITPISPRPHCPGDVAHVYEIGTTTVFARSNSLYRDSVRAHKNAYK
jgi:hypothetical protein